MKYSADDLQKVDALGHVRSNPKMYKGNAATIAGGIAQDAITLGATDTRVFRLNGWWIIAADTDWLMASCKVSASPIEAFNRILAFPEYGVNSMRHEILATAFATAVISLSHTDRFVVSGEIADSDPVWTHMLTDGVMRAVAFRMVA